jgi:methylmalonyl-CoA epimerase
MKGKILGIDHLGVAVRDPRARLALWSDVLDLPLERVESVPSEGVRTWFVAVGGPHVELLEPLSEDSTVAKSLDKRGEGIHHLCLRVDDIEAVIARLAARGIEPIGGGARPGAGGCRVAFLHPRDTGGILLELSQAPGDGAPASGEPGGVFETGELAVAYLQNPRQKVFGVICSLDERGLAIQGFDLETWEDWLSQCAAGESGPLGPSLQFFPSSRIEKLLADRPQPGLPSLSERFAERTGGDLATALAGAGAPPAGGGD